jgi:hypothetical protein
MKNKNDRELLLLTAIFAGTQGQIFLAASITLLSCLVRLGRV